VTRGVLYITWGDSPRTHAMLERSIASLNRIHPELSYHIADLPADSTLLDKATMADLTPFDETLFLDADTVVLDRLDYGFLKARKHGLACCICEAPWARRYGGLKDKGDIQEFNTGVLFFTAAAKPVFEAWKALAGMDSSIRFMHGGNVAVMPQNDQGPFSAAVEQTGFIPWVLPLNYNFRPIWQWTFFGPIKVFHDYGEVPASLAAWNASQNGDDSIIQFARLPK
jgi:hypothetical protein